MAKHSSRYLLTEDKIRKYIAEGRGKGTGSDYRPWHQMNEIPSRGVSTRYVSVTTRRLCHVFSLNELRTLVIFDWSERASDIREQYPLFPREETGEIAGEMGVRHPHVNQTDTDYVMTTDLLITLQTDEGPTLLAIAVKPVSELEKKRVLEKLEIERRYWEKRNVKWQIVTDQDIPKVFATNALLLLGHYFLDDRGFHPQLLEDGLAFMEPQIREHERPLRDITNACDREFGLDAGKSLSMIYHMLATKQWHVNMLEPLDATKPLKLLD